MPEGQKDITDIADTPGNLPTPPFDKYGGFYGRQCAHCQDGVVPGDIQVHRFAGGELVSER